MGAVEIDDKALLGALAAFRALDKDTRKAVQTATRTTLTPLWQKILRTRLAVAQRGHPKQDAKMLGKGRVQATVGGKGSLVAYNGRALSGGFSTWPGIEFGAVRYPQLPGRNPTGRIAYPAVKSWAPTAASVWMRVIADTIREVPGVEDA